VWLYFPFSYFFAQATLNIQKSILFFFYNSNFFGNNNLYKVTNENNNPTIAAANTIFKTISITNFFYMFFSSNLWNYTKDQQGKKPKKEGAIC
jgi:hypothetical protein